MATLSQNAALSKKRVEAVDSETLALKSKIEALEQEKVKSDVETRKMASMVKVYKVTGVFFRGFFKKLLPYALTPISVGKAGQSARPAFGVWRVDR
jgi:hypothetical protein